MAASNNDQVATSKELHLLLAQCCLSWAVVAGWLWCAIHPALAQSTSELHLPAAFQLEARLIDVNPAGHCVFQAGDQKQSLPAEQLVRWSAGVNPAGSPAVALSDGSWLSGDIEWLSDQHLRIKSQWFQPVDLNLDSIRGLILNPSPSAVQNIAIQSRVTSASGSADTIWNRRSEPLSGLLSPKLKPSGVSENPASRLVWSFRPADSDKGVELRSEDIEAIALSPVLRRPLGKSPPPCLVTMRDGSRLHVTGWAKLSDGTVQLDVGDRIKLVSLDDATQFVSSISELIGRPVDVTWLDQLQPARYRMLDESTRLQWPLGRNKDLFGRRLFDNHHHPIERGLVVHSPCQVAYRWEPPAETGGGTRRWRFLSAVSLVATESGGSIPPEVGSATCQVLVGRDGKLNKLYQSPVIGREADRPHMVDVEVTGAQLIVLLVDQADQGTVGDHVLWREPRIAPAP